MRDGFIIHEKTMAQVAKLSNEQAGELLKAMINHYNGEENGEVSLIVDVLLVDVEERMDSDKASYEELSRKRSEAGKNGAKNRWQNDGNDKANDGKAMANDGKAIANDGVSDSVSVSESVLKENPSTKGKRKKQFVPPTIDEVREYCLERQNGIDPEEFWAFYDARNWMSGKTKLSNWKSCVITWEKGRKRDAPSANNTKIRPVNNFDKNLMLGDFDAENRANIQKLINQQAVGGA